MATPTQTTTTTAVIVMIVHNIRCCHLNCWSDVLAFNMSRHLILNESALSWVHSYSLTQHTSIKNVARRRSSNGKQWLSHLGKIGFSHCIRSFFARVKKQTEVILSAMDITYSFNRYEATRRNRSTIVFSIKSIVFIWNEIMLRNCYPLAQSFFFLNVIPFAAHWPAIKIKQS